MRHRVKKTGPVRFMNVKNNARSLKTSPFPSTHKFPSWTNTSCSSTPSHCRLRHHFPDPKHLLDLKRLIMQTEHPASTPVQHPQAEFKDQFSSTSQHLGQTFPKNLPDPHHVKDIP